MRLRPFLLLLAAWAAAPRPALRADGGRVSVAAAANLSFALDALDQEFTREHPEIAVTSVTGASGDIVAQVEHGAPYDVFLSADRHFPDVLVAAGKADASTLSTFAVGQLVLWTTRDGLDLADLAAVVHNPAVRKLAIANVTTAPFGRAARQALEHLGLWADAEPKLVVGESVSQATQFVATGNADAGFVALSVVLAPRLKGQGHFVAVPANLYDPLEQGAVATALGAKNPAAGLYLAYLHGPEARAILIRFGYQIPAPKSARPG